MGRRATAAGLLLAAACGTPSLGTGLDRYRAALRAEEVDPVAARADYETARRELVASLASSLEDATKVDLCARIAHCELELARPDLATEYLDRVHEILERIPAGWHESLPGDRVLLFWARAEHHSRIAAGVVDGLGDVPARRVDLELDRALEERTRANGLFYQAGAAGGSPLLLRYLELRKAESQRDTADLQMRLAERQNLPDRAGMALTALRAARQIAAEQRRMGAAFDEDFRALLSDVSRREEEVSRRFPNP